MTPSEKAYNMISKWLEDGEVSGTDHYIGKEYDEEEYNNLLFLKHFLRYQIKINKVLDNLFIIHKGEEEEHESNIQES